MSESDDWIELRQRNGGLEFAGDLSAEVFSGKEIATLRSWGHVLSGLASGTMLPLNNSQRRFVDVVKGKEKPQTIAELAWMKWQMRVDNQYLLSDIPNRTHNEEGEEWYPRAECTHGIHFNRDVYFNRVRHR